MDNIELNDYKEEISSQKDKDNNKTIKDFINQMGKVSPESVNTEGEIYKSDLSVYFIPLHSSQYVYVCVSEEPIDIHQLEVCETKEDIIEAGQSMSSSFRPVSGGKVKANDPLLGSIHSYVANENKDQEFNDVVQQILKVVCGESNEIIAAMKKEQNEYDQKLDLIDEMQFHLAVSIQATQKGDIDKLKADLAKFTEELELNSEERRKFDANIVESLTKMNERREAGKAKLKAKYGEDEEEKNFSQVLLRAKAGDNQALICTMNGDVEKEVWSNVHSSYEAKEAGIKVDGGAFYSKNNPANPTENDIYYKAEDVEKELAKRKDYEDFNSQTNTFLEKFTPLYAETIAKYETKDKKLKNSIEAIKQNIDRLEHKIDTNTAPGIPGVQADEKTLDMTCDEMIEQYDYLNVLKYKIQNNHNKLEAEYQNKIKEINDLAMNGKMPEDLIKSTSKHAYECNQLLEELYAAKTKMEEHVTLQSNLVASGHEVDNDDLVFGENGIVTDEEYAKDEPMPGAIPIKSGDEIIGYINPDNSKEEEPKKEEWDPDSLDVKITHSDGEVEIIKSKKAQEIDALKEISKQVNMAEPPVVYNNGVEVDPKDLEGKIR